jgi:4-amino-4-deoxy-L-arabinose transferase-like glycosyltransferase
MTHPRSREFLAENRPHPPSNGSRSPALGAWACAAIAVVAAGLRLYQLGRLSFWYDEVVSMRLARTGSPRELIGLLFEIDATRAPLHPLLLQPWLRLFGTSEFAGRSFSVLCGIATVVLIYQIGRTAFDTTAGLWAAWLATFSPILVVYSREARMYAWLVLVTCLCWLLLVRMRRSFTVSAAVAYVLCVAAVVYSHPLGMLMFAALALAGLLHLQKTSGGARTWLAIHGAAAILILPWIGHYFDHSPEFLTERLPVRFLLATPIGFIGGNGLLLAGLVLVIGFGMIVRARESAAGATRSKSEAIPALLLCWLILPPVALYLYSLLFHPVFGPARYTAFVAPAYLVLVAAGLGRLPRFVQCLAVIGLAVVSSSALSTSVYDPELKADWRDFASELAARQADEPSSKFLVVVSSTSPGRNVEVETARYYLLAECDVQGFAVDSVPLLAHDQLFFTASARAPGAQGVPESIGQFRFREQRRYPGLIVYRLAR